MQLPIEKFTTKIKIYLKFIKSDAERVSQVCNIIIVLMKIKNLDHLKIL
jgi:hypothetical protein